jgi:hypothetical protein
MCVGSLRETVYYGSSITVLPILPDQLPLFGEAPCRTASGKMKAGRNARLAW